MSLFIFTPTAAVKSYCDVAWTDSVKAQTFTDFQHVVVDTSPAAVGSTYATRLRSLLPNAQVVRRSNLADMELSTLLVLAHKGARTAFLETTATAYVSWESDVVAASDALTVINTVASQGIDIAVFSYPDRENALRVVGGLGFTMLSRAVVEAFTWDASGGHGRIDDLDPSVTHSPEGWLITRARRAGFKIGSFDNLISFEHPNG